MKISSEAAYIDDQRGGGSGIENSVDRWIQHTLTFFSETSAGYPDISWRRCRVGNHEDRPDCSR